jgi:hypothetical protein
LILTVLLLAWFVNGLAATGLYSIDGVVVRELNIALTSQPAYLLSLAGVTVVSLFFLSRMAIEYLGEMSRRSRFSRFASSNRLVVLVSVTIVLFLTFAPVVSTPCVSFPARGTVLYSGGGSAHDVVFDLRGTASVTYALFGFGGTFVHWDPTGQWQFMVNYGGGIGVCQSS